ncbi:hypothetical protein DL96DRAFT_1582248 [Flagelloscypha sp. PMI_526]|nr:hypothetical protein DL96DRAFT_1582248 [Flagelloscypha sp. PMI_526]
MAATFVAPSASEDNRAALRHAVAAVVIPYELGILMSMFLLGVLTVAARSYFNKFKDRIFIKILVTFIWCITLAQVILGILAVQDMTVEHYGDYANLAYFPKFVNVNLILSGLVCLTTQWFFAYRLWRLSHSLIIPLICWTLMIALVGMVLTTVVLLTVVPQSERTFQFFTQTHRPLIVAILVISAAVDILITTSLMSYLWLQRRGIFERTKKIVDRLILWTFQTGLLTCTCTVAMLVTYLTMDNFVWLGILYTKPGLFALSLLASLNGRRSTSKAFQESIDSSILFPPSSSQGVHKEMVVNITTAHFTVQSDPEKGTTSQESIEVEPSER